MSTVNETKEGFRNNFLYIYMNIPIYSHMSTKRRQSVLAIRTLTLLRSQPLSIHCLDVSLLVPTSPLYGFQIVILFAFYQLSSSTI